MSLCITCGKRFSTKWSLNRHERETHSQPAHCCELCGAAFRRSYRLRMHLASSSCSASNLSFSNQPSLHSSTKSCDTIKPTYPGFKTNSQSLNSDVENHSQNITRDGQVGSGTRIRNMETSSSASDDDSQSSGSGIGEMLPCFKLAPTETESAEEETEAEEEEEKHDAEENETSVGAGGEQLVDDWDVTDEGSSGEVDEEKSDADSGSSDEVSSEQECLEDLGDDVGGERSGEGVNSLKPNNYHDNCGGGRKLMYWKPMPNRFRLVWPFFGENNLMVQHCAWLGKIYIANHAERLKMMLNVTSSQIDCISEICCNVLQGYVPLTQSNYRKFEKFLSLLRSLSSKETTFNKKQRSLLHLIPAF